MQQNIPHFSIVKLLASYLVVSLCFLLAEIRPADILDKNIGKIYKHMVRMYIHVYMHIYICIYVHTLYI